jgi:hypothetical protein
MANDVLDHFLRDVPTAALAILAIAGFGARGLDREERSNDRQRNESGKPLHSKAPQ